MTNEEARAYLIKHCNPDYPNGKTQWEKAIKENKKNAVSYLLFDELCNIYCYNCENQETEDGCEYCHRKDMNWRLSRKTADSLAERIDKIYKEG